ncbi:MAG: 4Fe-4S binding protein, partial [Chloroflexi bacterium]|nr:4Fe-4S binding protein [Chloroflexota bacterium]
MIDTVLSPEFKVVIDRETCIKCKRCVMGCGFGTLSFADRVIADHKKCVACHYCVTHCPTGAIVIQDYPLAYKGNANWSVGLRKNLWKQSETGGVLLTGMGNDQPYQIIWDHLGLDACQVTNPSIDPLREPMELRTYIGRKPELLEFDDDGRLVTSLEPNFQLETPIVFS